MLEVWSVSISSTCMFVRGEGHAQWQEYEWGSWAGLHSRDATRFEFLKCMQYIEQQQK